MSIIPKKAGGGKITCLKSQQKSWNLAELWQKRHISSSCYHDTRRKIALPSCHRYYWAVKQSSSVDLFGTCGCLNKWTWTMMASHGIRDSGFSYWFFTHLYIPWIRLVVNFVSDFVWKHVRNTHQHAVTDVTVLSLPNGIRSQLSYLHLNHILSQIHLMLPSFKVLRNQWQALLTFFCVKLILCMQLQLKNIMWNCKAMFTPQPLYNQQANSMQKIYHVLLCPLLYTK